MVFNTKFIALHFLLFFAKVLNAQTIPVYTPKDEEVVKPKVPTVKKTNVVIPKKLKVNVVPEYHLTGFEFLEDLRIENMYPVQDWKGKDNKYGFIDSLGQIKVPLQYDDAKGFYNGLAAVKKNNKWGYIDKNGNTVIPFAINDLRFSSPGSFYKGVAPIYDQNEKWGLIDKNNIKINDFIYSHIYDFVDDFAIVYNKTDTSGYKFGFINTLGKEVSTIDYDEVSNFYEGLALVCKKFRCGFIDHNGKIIIPIKYSSLVYISDCSARMQEGLIPVANSDDNNKIGFINAKNELVIPFQFDQNVPSSGLDGKYGFINGVSIAGKNKKWGFINKKGDEVVQLKYDKVSYFNKNRAMVEKKDQTGKYKYGFVDSNGVEVIPLIYDYVVKNPFKYENYAEVTLKDKRFKIDINGNKLK